MSILRNMLLITATLAGIVALPASALAKVNVVATLPDLAAITREVGGPDVNVTALAYPTQDPHFVDARPSLILPLNRADLLVVDGLELELGWLPTLIGGARNNKIAVGSQGYLDASSVIPVLEVPTQRVERSMGDVHPGGNPHYTVDPRKGAQVAIEIAQRLGAIDPAHRAGYEARAKVLKSQAEGFAVEQAKRFAGLPAARRQIVTYHKSLVYLIDWLHLNEVDTIEPKPGIPPSPPHIAAVLGEMRQRGVKAVVQEVYYPSAAGKLLAAKGGAHFILVPGGTNFDQGQTYLGYLRTLTNVLYEGLK